MRPHTRSHLAMAWGGCRLLALLVLQAVLISCAGHHAFPPHSPSSSSDLSSPVRRALCIGIGRYENFLPIAGAPQDAREVAALLSSRFGFQDVRILADPADSPDGAGRSDPITLARVREELTALASRTSPNDDVLVFFSGHGLPGALVTSNTEPDTPTKHSLGLEELTQRLRAMNALHSLLILDSCYSGSVFDPRMLARLSSLRTSSPELTGSAFATPFDRVLQFPSYQIISAGSEIDPVADAQLKTKAGVLALAAGSEDYSQHRTGPDPTGLSLFTDRLVLGLSGPAGQYDGQVSASSLGVFMSELLASRGVQPGSLQVPQYGKVGGGPGEFVFTPAVPILGPRIVAPLYAAGESESQSVRQLKAAAANAVSDAVERSEPDARLGLSAEAIGHLLRAFESSETDEVRQATAESLFEILSGSACPPQYRSRLRAAMAKSLDIATLAALQDAVSDVFTHVLDPAPSPTDLRTLEFVVRNQASRWAAMTNGRVLPFTVERDGQQLADEVQSIHRPTETPEESCSRLLNLHARYRRLLAEGLGLPEQRVFKAGRLVLAGQRLVDSDPATALKLAFAASRYEVTPSVASLVRDAVRRRPPRQELRVEQRRQHVGVEVLPSQRVALRRLLFAHEGRVLVLLHADDRASVWNVDRQECMGTFSNVHALAVAQDFPERIAVLGTDGSLTLHRLRFDGSTESLRVLPGVFAGFSQSADGGCEFAFQANGIVKGLRPTALAIPPLSGEGSVLAVAGSEQLAWALTDRGALCRWNAGQTHWTVVARVDIPNPAAGMSNVDLFTLPSLDAMVLVFQSNVTRALRTSAVIQVFDTSASRTIWTHTADDVAIAVHPQSGKIGFLDNTAIEQYQIEREANGLRVANSADRWDVMPHERDVGEPVALAYDPSGEYLATCNSPILYNVGPPPSTARLWYANRLTDCRAGDPHGGELIGLRTESALNLAFDSTGSRVATFVSTGWVRIWNIRPGSQVNISTKAGDYFSRQRYSPAFDRQLQDIGNPNLVLEKALEYYRLRFSSLALERIDERLATDQELDLSELLGADLSGPGSVALQLRDRDEPDETSAIPQGGLLQVSLSDNAVFAELLDDIISRAPPADEEVCRRYCRATERHPSLLTGLHLPSSIADLQSPFVAVRARGYVTVALAGDNSALPALEGALQIETDDRARSTGQWARSFLMRHGRDLSLHGLIADSPLLANRTPLWSAPVPSVAMRMETLSTIAWSRELVEAIRNRASQVRQEDGLALLDVASRLQEESNGQQWALAMLVSKAAGPNVGLKWFEHLSESSAGRIVRGRASAECARLSVELGRGWDTIRSHIERACLAGCVDAIASWESYAYASGSDEAVDFSTSSENLLRFRSLMNGGEPLGGSSLVAVDDTGYNPLGQGAPLGTMVSHLVAGPIPSDAVVCLRYLETIAQDPLLVTGFQIPAMLRALAHPDSDVQVQGIVGLALSADLSQTEAIESWLKAPRNRDAVDTGQWALRFLRSHGRDLSVAGLASTRFHDLGMYAALPTPCLFMVDDSIQPMWSPPYETYLLNWLRSDEPSKSVSELVSANWATRAHGRTFIENLVVMLRDRGAYEAALSMAEPLLMDFGASGEHAGRAENLYGYIVLKAGNARKATTYFEAAIAAGLDNGWPQHNWAECLAARGDNEGAERLFVAAIEHAEAKRQRAERQLGERYAEWFESFRADLASFHNALAWHLVCTCAERPGSLTRAHEEARRACDLSNNSSAIFLDTLAEVQWKQGNAAAAIETESLAIERSSSPADRSLFEKKRARWLQGQP